MRYNREECSIRYEAPLCRIHMTVHQLLAIMCRLPPLPPTGHRLQLMLQGHLEGTASQLLFSPDDSQVHPKP